MAATFSEAFISAVLNDDWEQADQIYAVMPADQLDAASKIFEYLVKQYRQADLERVLKNHPKLNVNALNRKGQSALMIAFHVANEAAAQALYNAGADPLLVTPKGSNDIQEYAGWSKRLKMVDLAKTMKHQTSTIRDMAIVGGKQVKPGRREPTLQKAFTGR